MKKENFLRIFKKIFLKKFLTNFFFSHLKKAKKYFETSVGDPKNFLFNQKKFISQVTKFDIFIFFCQTKPAKHNLKISIKIMEENLHVKSAILVLLNSPKGIQLSTLFSSLSPLILHRHGQYSTQNRL